MTKNQYSTSNTQVINTKNKHIEYKQQIVKFYVRTIISI